MLLIHTFAAILVIFMKNFAKWHLNVKVLNGSFLTLVYIQISH